ncbi:uncharacterized protein [Euphorbia lathyris]|uniref:uncharacterized protein n=1 Tax=Euphorbia lathyris TaxID=212925 RepID=UPI003313D700
MAGRTEIVEVKEEVEGSAVSELLKTSFTQVEEVFLSREENLKMEIQGKDREIEGLAEELRMFKKENRELRGVVTHVAEERAGYLEKMEESTADKREIVVLKMKNCALECARLKAETEVDVCKRTVKAKRDELQRFEKKYAESKELAIRLTKERDALQGFEKECGELKELVTRLTEERDGLQRFEKECTELKELVARLTEERDGLRRFEKESGELKELVTGLREERDCLLNIMKDHEYDKKEIEELKRKNCELESAKLNAEIELHICRGTIKEVQDELLKRVKENQDDKEEIIELKRKNSELECAKLNAETEMAVNKGMLKGLSERVLSLEKDWEIEKGGLANLSPDTNAVKMHLGTNPNPNQNPNPNPNPSGGERTSKLLLGTNPNPNPSSGERTVKLLLGTNPNPSGGERTDMVGNIDNNDAFSSPKRAKRIKVEQPVPFASPIQHGSPAALNLETRLNRNGNISAKLAKVLNELGDSSSSSSSSDEEVDLSLDYSSIFRTPN